jgi:hypothetical protein
MNAHPDARTTEEAISTARFTLAAHGHVTDRMARQLALAVLASTAEPLPLAQPPSDSPQCPWRLLHG